MYAFSNFEPIHCSMSSSNCCFLSCRQVSQKAGKVVWNSHLFKNFPQFVLIHTVKGFSVVNEALTSHFNSRNENFWNSLAFTMIQQMLVIWSLVPLPFLNPAWRSGNSQFMNSWSLACRILSTTLLTCEMNAIVQWFEHFLALLFFGTGMKTDLFQSYGHCWVFQICCVPLGNLVSFESLISHMKDGDNNRIKWHDR